MHGYNVIHRYMYVLWNNYYFCLLKYHVTIFKSKNLYSYSDFKYTVITINYGQLVTQ